MSSLAYLTILSVLPVITPDSVSTYQVPIPNIVKAHLGYPEKNLLDFTEVATKSGYDSEGHVVTTDDGYILKLYHLTNNNYCKRLIKPPVLLMHGLLLSSDVWLDAGPNVSLAFLLADSCYDLWIGNVRGNYLGRRHVRFNPDKDPKFWDFSYHDMGLFDIPANIDYILKVTKSETLNYIGYSQGGSTFAIMCSERPGYCEKANTFIGLAPASRMLYTRSALFRITSELLRSLQEFLSSIGIYEVFFKGSILQEILELVCSKPNFVVCQGVIATVDAYDPKSISNQTLRTLYAHLPAGTSVKNFVAYSQSLQSKQFKKFDYGRKINLSVYGSPNPPIYNLTRISIPTLFLSGLNDFIVDARDVYWFQQQIPLAEVKVVKSRTWTHFDIPYSSFIPQLIFPDIDRQLRKYSYIRKYY